MNFEAPKNTETKSELEKFEEELKGLSDNIYRKDIDKKISKIREQMSQKSAYDDEEYYTLQDSVEELESQKEKGYDGFYVSENEKKIWEIDNEKSKNISEINNLINEYIEDLENVASQKSAYYDEEYYALQEKIEKLKELRSSENIYYLTESKLADKDEVLKKIIKKNKERNLLVSEFKNVLSSLSKKEGEDEKEGELFYILRKIQFKQFEEALKQVEKSKTSLKKSESNEETSVSQPETKLDSKVYEFDEILEGSSEQNEELKIQEVSTILTDIGAKEDVVEIPKDMQIEEIDDLLTNTEINFKEGVDNKETNIHEIDEILNEKHDQQASKKADEVIKKLAEIKESAQEQEENLSPEKQSIFKRLKESLKKEDTQKRILIFAIASGVSITIPFASIAFYGGGLLGLGAGASVPLLELVGLGAHSAAIGGPVGAVSIFKGLEKVLKWKFIPTEENKLSDREIEDIVINVKNVLEKELL